MQSSDTQADSTPVKPIARKVALALAGFVAVTLGILWLILATNLQSLLNSQTETFGNAIAKQSAYAASELVLADDLLSLNVIATKLAEDSNVESASFFDANNKLLAQSGNAAANDPANNTLLLRPSAEDTKPTAFNSYSRGDTYVAPVTFQDVLAGYAQITLNKESITSTIRNSIQWMSIATIFILIISFILSFILGRHITHPVKLLTQAANAIAGGNLDYRITETRNDEIGRLINSFNSMAQGIKERQQIENTFSQYMAPDIAQNILSNLDQPGIPSQYVNASVLFLDIVGFTAMCEDMEPEEVAKLLNEYYYFILKTSTLYNGSVDKFIGDGAMIIFGAIEEDLEHASHAIFCAELLLCLVGKLNTLRAQKGLPIAEFKLGIHCGEMLAGTLGCSEHMQYTVVGNTVNLASRLCNTGQAGKLVISEKVYHASQLGNKLDVEKQVSLTVKGKSEPISVYIIDGLKDDYLSLIESQANDLLSPKLMADQAEIKLKEQSKRAANS